MRIDQNNGNVKNTAPVTSKNGKVGADTEKPAEGLDKVTLSSSGRRVEIAPEDAIRDIAVAGETSGLSKNMILDNAELAVKAQANLNPERVLQLLS